MDTFSWPIDFYKGRIGQAVQVQRVGVEARARTKVGLYKKKTGVTSMLAMMTFFSHRPRAQGGVKDYKTKLTSNVKAALGALNTPTLS